ncbi:MAG: MBL fold metallo-hydrolase [Clostridia bacterium]|nr:MBL fold metallo-hydrolase [Clostridia bacterium]
MIEGIEVLCHSSIRICREGKMIYFDPFQVDRDRNDADYILITHSHYDHFSVEDIFRVKKEDTVIIVPEDLFSRALDLGFHQSNIISVVPNQFYKVNEIEFETIPAYNTNKAFHPKENNWVGYILKLGGNRYYIAGDTDITEENKKVVCDVAFVPVGGTYTMTYKEAAELVNMIKPKFAIPTHYGTIVGERKDGMRFQELLDSDIKCKIDIT